MILQLLEKVIELENWTEGKGLIVHGAKNNFSSGSDLHTVKALGTPEASIVMNYVLTSTCFIRHLWPRYLYFTYMVIMMITTF